MDDDKASWFDLYAEVISRERRRYWGTHFDNQHLKSGVGMTLTSGGRDERTVAGWTFVPDHLVVAWRLTDG